MDTVQTRSGTAPTTPWRGRDTAAAVALVLAWLNGPAAYWLYVEFQLFGDSPDPEDYWSAAASLATLAVALPAVTWLLVRGLRLSPALMWVAVGGAVAHLLFALGAWTTGRGAEQGVGGPGFFDPAEAATTALVLPPSWPLGVLVLVALVALVRGRSSRAPR